MCPTVHSEQCPKSRKTIVVPPQIRALLRFADFNQRGDHQCDGGSYGSHEEHHGFVPSKQCTRIITDVGVDSVYSEYTYSFRPGPNGEYSPS
jgi:hypothetical protein